MSEWGWTPERNLGIWRHGAGWLRPFAAAAPYLTVGVLLLMFGILGGRLTSAKGVLFDLPDGEFRDARATALVALVMPDRREMTVFFDDSRYVLGDDAAMRRFFEELSERAARLEDKTLLILADRRVSAGVLMEFVADIRKNGVERVLVAGKQSGDER